MQIFVNSSGRCPHGSLPGACPMCGGGGGGSAAGIGPNTASSSKKPKVVVGMSWAEAASEFRRLQNIDGAAKENKQMHEANLIQRQLSQVLAHFISNGKMQQLVQAFQSAFVAPVATALNTLTNATVNTINTITNTLKNTATTFTNNLSETISVIIGIGEKIAAIFGEKFEAVRNFVEHNLKNIFRKIFQENILRTLMTTVFNQQEKLAGFVRDSVSKLVDRLIGLFPFLEEDEEDYLFKENKRRFKLIKKFKVL